jgi:hypothetical protein
VLRQTPGKFAYTLETITQNAPVMSGVYMLFSRMVCVYVGASDDICASLLEHYFEDNPCLNDKEITHFTVEVVSPAARSGRQADCIRDLRPVCHLLVGTPGCGHCRFAQASEPGALMAVSGKPSL